MKVRHLKSFPQHTNYEEYKEGGNINKPHVAYCIKENEVHYDPYIDPYNGHEYVDLGLPSGTMWSTKNVGAETVTDKGLFSHGVRPLVSRRQPKEITIQVLIKHSVGKTIN